MSKELETHKLEHIPDTFYYECTVCGIYLLKIFVGNEPLTGNGSYMWLSIEESYNNFPYVFKVVSCNEYLMQKALM